MGWLKSTRRLAGLLNPLGIVRQQIRTGMGRRWCYLLQSDQLADPRVRYGGVIDVADALAQPALPGGDPVRSGDNPHE